jgi:alanyl-tRNA synthetase
VRVVGIGGFSKELCGGTHVRNTAEIGVFVFVQETGIAAGVRRVEALTARGAFTYLRSREALLHEVADLLKGPVDLAPKKVQQLLDDRRAMEKRIAEALKGGGGGLGDLLGKATSVRDVKVARGEVKGMPDMKALLALGEAAREQIGSGVAVLATTFEDGKAAMVVAVTDDVRARGAAADAIVKALAALAGGRGGGKPHMAQAGLPSVESIATVLAAVDGVVVSLMAD